MGRLSGRPYISLYILEIFNGCILLIIMILTHSLLEIFRKTRFEASRVVFWSLSCYKELKLTTNRFIGHTLHGLLIQMQNISLRSSGMRRKQNFDIVFGFKSDTAVLTFTFCFLSSPLFLLFLPHFFFSC